MTEVKDGEYGILDHLVNGLYVVGAWGKGIRGYFEKPEDAKLFLDALNSSNKSLDEK